MQGTPSRRLAAGLFGRRFFLALLLLLLLTQDMHSIRISALLRSTNGIEALALLPDSAAVDASYVVFAVVPDLPYFSVWLSAYFPSAGVERQQRQQQQQQQRRGGPAAAVGPLFAKPLAYDVTYKPTANSSVVLNLDIPGETTKVT